VLRAKNSGVNNYVGYRNKLDQNLLGYFCLL